MAVPTIRSEISVRQLQEQELSAAIGSSVGIRNISWDS
jgi:hypothetical protein